MKRSGRIFIVGMGMLLLVSSVCHAGSIWAKANTSRRALHTDETARQIGDILTVIIDEHSEIDNETSRQMKKKSSRDGSITNDISLLGKIDALTGRLFNLTDMSLEMDAANEFDGSADFDSDRSVKDQITVTVQDVQPNGNLVVLGHIERKVSGDTQIVQVSGVVRPIDVTFGNTINSEQIANFQITYSHRGRENRFTGPGWFSRILNILNPF